MGESVARVRLQGVLEKRGKFTGVFLTRKYHCTLENGHLKYRKDGEKEKGLDIGHVQYIRPGKDCSFEIVTQSSNHIFVAGSVSERDDWVRALRESMCTTSLRMPPTATKFPPPRSYSEDSAALYEVIHDSPILATKFPRSQTLSVSPENKSHKWLSVGLYETVRDPPDVPAIAIQDLPAKISEDKRGLVSPVAACGFYESVHEDGKCSSIHERDLKGVSSKSNLPISDEPSIEPDLYAYACADDVRNVVLKDKPKLCCEYSTVHDSRGSELLYSEVGVWGRAEERTSSENVRAVYGLATVLESTDGLKPSDDSLGIYHLAKDPAGDMTEDQTRPPGGDCYSGIKVSGEEITRVLPQSLGHPETPKVSASVAGLSTLVNATESNSKTVLDRNALESSSGQHKAVCLNALVSPKDFSVLYSKSDKPHCVPYPSDSFPAHCFVNKSTVLESHGLYNQGVKPLPDLCSKVVNQLSNESASISHSPASLPCASLAGNSTTFHKCPVLPCDTSDVYGKMVKPSLEESCTVSHSLSAAFPSASLAGRTTTFLESGALDIYTKVAKPATNNSILSKSAESCSHPKRIPSLPNPRISLKYQSAFDEIRTVMGETFRDGEVDELQSSKVPKGANAVDDLRQFLSALGK